MDKWLSERLNEDARQLLSSLQERPSWWGACGFEYVPLTLRERDRLVELIAVADTSIDGGSQDQELPTCRGCLGRCIEPLRDGLCAECWRLYPELRMTR